MQYEVNFGNLQRPAQAGGDSEKFRIAVLGDFSARANKGQLDTGDALAAHKPLRIDVDNLDELLERFQVCLQLPIGGDGGTIAVPITCMDDFHPDDLYDNLEIFSKLGSLRQRLMDSSAFAGAAKAVQSLFGAEAVAKHEHRVRARGTEVPNAKVSDFAALVGRPTATSPDTSVVQLIKEVVRDHVIPDKDPRQDQMVAVVDESLSDTARRVLHHPDFQSLEALWRCVEFLVRRLETDENLEIVLLDVTAEELAADLCSTDTLDETGLYKLLVEQPVEDAMQGPFSAIVSNYTFQQTPPHADLLGRVAKIAAAAQAPFIASISTDCLKKSKPEEIHPLVKQSWDDLRNLPESTYLALTVPRFMLRWPYGKKSDPISRFEFEEFTRKRGVRGMLWGNSAFLAGLLLGLTCQRQGLKEMQLGSIMTVDDLPFYYYIDDDGDQIALPCTDRLLSERLAQHVRAQHFLPVLSIKGRPEVRLGSFGSLSGQPLAGRWGSPSGQAPSAAPSSSLQAASTVGAEPVTPPAESPEPVEETPVASPAPADDDLDALLAGLDDTAASEPAAAEESPAADADDDLDALLAGLEADDEESSDDDMDPDLAALLGDL